MADNYASQTDETGYTDSNDADHWDWDNDSAMGDSLPSSTSSSLTSGATRYQHHYGRRYHAYRAGRYYMPNDEQEQELMDLVHYISLVVHDGLMFLAPVGTPTSILDVGTGTGTWAIDVADLFPGAWVIGTDLSPIQPTWVPPNLQFEVSDCEDEWTYSTQFDLVHMRNLSGSIHDWPELLCQAHQYLRPGGWLDTPNLDIWIESNNNALPEDSALAQWRHLIAEAVKQSGREPRTARLIAQRLKDAEFINVVEETFKLPLSPWIHDAKWKRIAMLMQYLMEKELEGMSLALFTHVLNWSVEDLQELLGRVRADMANPKYELYCNVHYVYGQKPREVSGGFVTA